MDTEEKNIKWFMYVKEIQGAASCIFQSRAEMYNNGIFAGDYYRHGIQDLTHEITKKCLRIESAAHSEKPEKAAGSIHDSVIDIINYAAFIWAYINTINIAKE